VWDGKTWTEPLSHGREFTKEEILENFGVVVYFF
jgi:hypothetical protein